MFSTSEFLPFGGGARRCIGEALASFEMKLVLERMLSRERQGVTFAPDRGVQMVLQEKL